MNVFIKVYHWHILKQLWLSINLSWKKTTFDMSWTGGVEGVTGTKYLKKMTYIISKSTWNWYAWQVWRCWKLHGWNNKLLKIWKLQNPILILEIQLKMFQTLNHNPCLNSEMANSFTRSQIGGILPFLLKQNILLFLTWFNSINWLIIIHIYIVINH